MQTASLLDSPGTIAKRTPFASTSPAEPRLLRGRPLGTQLLVKKIKFQDKGHIITPETAHRGTSHSGDPAARYPGRPAPQERRLFYCRRLRLEIKWANDLGHHSDECRFQETQDTHVLLDSLMRLWSATPAMKPLRIGVGLADLTPKGVHQPNLFDEPEPVKVTTAIDKMNSRFGRGTISFGSSAPPMTSKIAFQRVPKLDEF